MCTTDSAVAIWNKLTLTHASPSSVVSILQHNAWVHVQRVCVLWSTLLILILTWSLLLLLSFPTAPYLAHANNSQSSSGDNPPPPSYAEYLATQESHSRLHRSHSDLQISPARAHSQRRRRTGRTTTTSARNYVATNTSTPAIAANTIHRRQLRSSSQHQRKEKVKLWS